MSKVFKKLVNNRIVDHIEKGGLFSDFQYDFRSSRSTADLLTVVSDRIARAFNRSGATRAVALDISETFDRVWHAVLLHKVKSYGTSGQIFGLISSFLSNRRLQMVRLTGLITIVLLMWKWMSLFFRNNHLLRYWDWPSLLNRIWVLTLSLLLKLPPRKSEL